MAKLMEERSGHGEEHFIGSFSRLMQRVQSLEDLLSKLRWERGVEAKEEEERHLLDSDGFKVPLHYPRYSKAEYETMEEWRLDLIFRSYALDVTGHVEYKRNYAMAAFLWPD